jgi:hypothetical protein
LSQCELDTSQSKRATQTKRAQSLVATAASVVPVAVRVGLEDMNVLLRVGGRAVPPEIPPSEVHGTVGVPISALTQEQTWNPAESWPSECVVHVNRDGATEQDAGGLDLRLSEPPWAVLASRSCVEI